MKPTTPFTILNRKLNKMDLIRDAMQKRILATERLHDDYRIYKISFELKKIRGRTNALFESYALRCPQSR